MDHNQDQSDDVTQGNFLLDHEVGSIELDGGTSSSFSNAGSIVSPVIDLSSEGSPLSLRFKTWWEIESVNPNDQGFDLMLIEYAVRNADATVWTPLAVLNPSVDPVDNLNREPIPYSNSGYNQAPQWLAQENIPIDDLAGSLVQLRFSFLTMDNLYNGFRGWLVDDVEIIREQGSFPLYDGYFIGGSVDCESYDDNFCLEGDEDQI